MALFNYSQRRHGVLRWYFLVNKLIRNESQMCDQTNYDIVVAERVFLSCQAAGKGNRSDINGKWACVSYSRQGLC